MLTVTEKAFGDLSQELTQCALNAADCGFMVVDASGTVHIWNDWLHQATGVSAREAIGARLSVVLPGALRSLMEIVQSACGSSGMIQEAYLDDALHQGEKSADGRTPMPAHRLRVRRLSRSGFSGFCLIQVTAVGNEEGGEPSHTGSSTCFPALAATNDDHPQTQLILDGALDAILMLDDRGRIEFCNAATEKVFGYSRGELEGEPVSRLLVDQIPKTTGPFIAGLCVSQSGGGCTGLHELAMKRKDAEVLPVELAVSEIRYCHRKGYLVVVRDISRRKRSEAMLLREKLRAEVTLESINDAVITTDAEGRIEYLNAVAEQLTGWKNADARGMALQQVFQLITEDSGLTLDPAVVNRLREASWGAGMDAELILRGPEGAQFPIELSVAAIESPERGNLGSVIIFRDISHSRKMAAQLIWQANHDSLTGLENRKQFEQRLEHLLASAEAGNKRHALMYLDLDQFKVVNDTCGHAAGDEMLRRLTNVLNFKVRNSDTLARLGGDEFGVLLEDCALEPAVCLANELRKLVNEFRFTWEGKIFSVGLSIGLVSIDKNSKDAASVLISADMACYTAKDSGRNRVHVFEAGDSIAARRCSEVQWVSQIHEALQEGRFELHYQDIVPAAPNSDSAGYREILLRMRDSRGELIFPGAFIPAAERYNLMSAVDRWVIQSVLAYMANSYTATSAGGYGFSINLSGASLVDPNLLKEALQGITEYGVNPEKICFEVTETAAIANLDEAVEFIRALKEKGCKFALDDFGSGLSSFAYLKHLPVDYLKIDGTFVKDMLIEPIDCAMVEAINRVGHIMNIKTVAEFVEDAETLERLRDIGVDYVQGYHIARPRDLACLKEAFAL